MQPVEVIVPWRDGCRYRERALAWVLGQYRSVHPGWRVTVERAPAGPWRKAIPVTRAAARTGPELVIVADADIWTTGLATAVEQVTAGAAWAIPHTLVHRLTPGCTNDLLAGLDPFLEHDEKPYRGVAGGGVIVLPRRTLRDIPLDPRFTGWGQEDVSHAVALTALAGSPVRGTHDLLHLWHPPQPRANRKVGSHEGHVLHRRYLKARRDPALMRALIEEARHDDHRAHQPAVHAGTPG